MDMQEIVDTFLENPLLGIGYYGPILIFGMNLYFLYDRFFWVGVYIVFILINIIVNKILKKWIKDPRPTNWKSFATFERLEKEENYSQSVGFSLLFYYLLFGIDEVFYSMLFIAGLTIFQRYHNKNHTILQLICGLILGGIIAYMAYNLAKKYKNNISWWNI